MGFEKFLKNLAYELRSESHSTYIDSDIPLLIIDDKIAITKCNPSSVWDSLMRINVLGKHVILLVVYDNETAKLLDDPAVVDEIVRHTTFNLRCLGFKFVSLFSFGYILEKLLEEVKQR